MNNLDDIRVFLAVAEHQSFVGAARSLSMTPPSVTRAIGALEDHLGVQLLLRTTRRVSLTAAGAVYAARVAPLLKSFDLASDELRDQHGETAGLIRINAPMSLGQRVLPDVISQFRVLYPKVAMSVALTDRFIDIVSATFDLAIRISGPPKDKSTIWRKICRVERVLVASPAYVGRFGMPQTPEDLTEHNLIAYDPDVTEETWDLSRNGAVRRVRAGSMLATNNGDLSARLAVMGEGISVLPRFIVDDDLAAGRLQSVLTDWTLPELWLTLYYPPYERLPTRIAAFSDFFETYATKTRPM